MTDNLALTQVTENQANPEVPINDATGELGEALTEQLAIDLSAGNVTVTALQQRRNFHFKASGVATGGRTVTLASTVKRVILVECASANTNTIGLVRGSTTLTLSPGRFYIVITDGTADGIVARDVGGVSEPFDFHAFVPSTMVNAQLLFRMKATRAFTLPISLTGSFVTAVTGATGSTTVTFKKAGASIGTAVWSAAGTTAALTFASAVSFAVGDVFTIEGPATADATLADVSFDLLGSR